jgi:hypothetical protein
MTDQPDTGEAPVPDAAPAPAPVPSPSLITRLERELSEAKAAAAAAGGVLLRIAGRDPVTSITVAGVTVTKDPSPVPAHLAGTLTESASSAGVTLEEA